MAVTIKIDEEQIAKEIVRRLEKEYRKQLVYADNMLKHEFEKLYDQIIDQYYTYVTQYYYRHEVGKGTGNGLNLYRASDMHMDIGGGKFDDDFVFGLNENDMEGYKYSTPEQVLENVMSGWRRTSHDYTGWYTGTTSEEIKTDVNGNPYYVTTFRAKDVEVCGMYFSGTPYEILEQIKAVELVEKYRYKLFIQAVNSAM